MRIVFMGTPDFAVPVLENLVKEHEVVCVYTRSPKEAGRGNKLMKTPVHLTAEKYGLEIRTPRTFKNIEEQQSFKSLGADVAVVAAYGLILPQAVIEAPKYGCLNVHASLLPRWRGAAPIQRSIEAGDSESGVTIMQIVEALDAGAMYAKGTVPITSETTGGILHDKLAEIGAELMVDVLRKLPTLRPEPQDERLATYATKLEKTECRLDFFNSAEILERKIRAFNPFPAMFFEYGGERFKVLLAEVAEATGVAGEILEGEQELLISCGDKSLRIRQIQRQGKKAMTTEELLRGFKFAQGIRL